MAQFTDKYIKNLKAPETDIRIREKRGFAVYLRKNGRKIFEFIYAIDGKRRYMILGEYPSTSLAEAREKYNDAYNLYKKGIDPNPKEDIEEPISAPHPNPVPENLTVEQLKDKYITEWSAVHHCERWSYENRRALEKDLIPEWGHLSAGSLKRRDALHIIQKTAKRAPGQARNLLKAARLMYYYGVQWEYVEYNPFNEIDIEKDIPSMLPKSRDRVLDDNEIKTIWKGVEEGHGTDEYKRAIKLVLVTAQRPGEVLGMNSSEIDKDWWVIPWKRIKTEKTKRGKHKDHRVYLTPLAKSLVGEINGFLLKSPHGEDVVVERGYLSDQIVSENYYGIPRWTPHDLRRTARTLMARAGVLKDHAERVLNHSVGVIESTYDLHHYDKEKKAALLKLEKELLRILK